ncbi:MAG: hypothetical protein DWI08_01635 [Planctomycetota bacterium]|jgi:hypothetical protein|nr:hypothetical protein [Gemmataceae bacterium]MCY2972153.1 hypothetical protein [Planctomycetota bacterium]NBS89092.1 hypothetical protein [bacterium]NBT60862.1 hypothetical protein [Planctomycetia bacterium]MBJ7343783.1 hypothetical protein [Gemmataceae bacterium]
MKKLTTALLLGVFATTGCVTLPEVDKKAEISNSQEKTRGLSNDKVPVMADQINADNATKMLANLEEEVSRAYQEPLELPPDNN